MSARKWFFLLLLLLPWITQSVQRSSFRQAYVDADVNLAMAHQVLEKGLPRLPVATFSQPATKNLEPMPDLMPGYPWLLAIFLFFKISPYTALLLADILAIGVIWGWMVVFVKKYGGQEPWAWLAFLLWGTMTLTPWRYLGGSDLAALACLLPALSFAHRSTTERGWKPLTGMMILALLAFFMRYAYLPFCLALPAWVAWVRFQKPQKSGFVLPLITSLVAMLVLATWIFWEKANGSGTYLYETERTFYPEHLLMIDPFPLKSIVYFGVPHLLAASKLLHVGWQLLHQAGWLIVGVMVFFAGKIAWKQRSAIAPEIKTWLGLWVLTGGIIGAMLVALSITHAPQDWNWVGFWTFVMETRYYAPILVGIQVLIAIGLIHLLKSPIRTLGLTLWVGMALLQGVLSWRMVASSNPSVGDWRRHEGPSVYQKSKQLRQQADLPVVFTDLDGGWGPGVAGIPEVPADSWVGISPDTLPDQRVVIIHSPLPDSVVQRQLDLWMPFRVAGPDTLPSGRIWEVMRISGNDDNRLP